MTIGHNSKTTKAGPLNADRLKSFIERIEKLEEERKAIGGDIKDVYSEAKGVGYDVATMRKIVAIRAKDSADVAEAETLLDVYKHALGMLTGGAVTTVRVPVEPSEDELEERAGRIAAEVDRCMDLITDGHPPGIYAIQNLINCSTGKASKLRGMVMDRISRGIIKLREMKKPEDGDDDITESMEAGSIGVEAGRPSKPSAPAEQSVNAVPPPGLVTPESENGKGEQPGTLSVGAVAAEPRVAPFILPSRSSWASITAVREAHHAAIEAAREAKREARRREMEQLNKLAAITDADMPEPFDFLQGPSPANRSLRP